MFVFHTLSAGNIGQPGAPGTVVPAAAGVLAVVVLARVVLAEAVADGADDADPAAGNGLTLDCA
ncbi:MAG: hypothetical protein WAK71_28230, partial [Streptosporangiaceae bacterium]